MIMHLSNPYPKEVFKRTGSTLEDFILGPVVLPMVGEQ